MAKSNRPGWFKVYLHHQPLVESVPDVIVGRAIKAVMTYFKTGEVVEMDAVENVLFSCFKPCVDQSFVEYIACVENGRKGGRPRKAPVTDTNDPQVCQTEQEEEKEKNKNKNIYKNKEKDEDQEHEQEKEAETEEEPVTQMTESEKRAFWKEKLEAYT